MGGVGGDHGGSLRIEDAGEDEAAAAAQGAGNAVGELTQRAGEDVGDDQVEGQGMPQPRVVEAERTGRGDAAGAVGVGVGARHLYRNGV